MFKFVLVFFFYLPPRSDRLPSLLLSKIISRGRRFSFVTVSLYLYYSMFRASCLVPYHPCPEVFLRCLHVSYSMSFVSESEPKMEVKKRSSYILSIWNLLILYIPFIIIISIFVWKKIHKYSNWILLYCWSLHLPLSTTIHKYSTQTDTLNTNHTFTPVGCHA